MDLRRGKGLLMIQMEEKTDKIKLILDEYVVLANSVLCFLGLDKGYNQQIVIYSGNTLEIRFAQLDVGISELETEHAQ